MRILVVVHDFQPGGAERIAIRLASHWAAEGHQVAIVCGNPVGVLRSVLGEGVQLLMPAKSIHRSRYSRAAVAAFAARMARVSVPDVIFLPGNYYSGMAPRLKLRLGRRCPIIVTKLSNTLRRAGRGRASQAVFDVSLTFKTAFTDHLILMSPELLDEARKSMPWGNDRYSVIAQPVLDEALADVFPARTAHDRNPLLVAAGRLKRQKNFAGLIDAVAQLDRPFRLVIYGEGPERARLESRIAALGLTDRISFPGYTDELGAKLLDARLFVLSSNYEGFPSVLVEALAAGVPVVATDCSPAIGAIIGNVSAGILIPVDDPAAMAKAIAENLDRPRPDHLGLTQSVDRFRLGASAKAYLELFRRLTVTASDMAPR